MKKKKRLWFKIINFSAISILFVLTIIFLVLYILYPGKYDLAFFIFVFIFGLWIVVLFTGTFLFYKKEDIAEGTKKLVADYKKKPKNDYEDTINEEPTAEKETKEEEIKRLEEELKKLKDPEK
ncbi:hypothetical protein P344_00310 [Spiroplasma mirum ATCC 29335]|uniref:Uncharacterized protein n=1 Tax=Spiroplasma mirum ATCC 29335 TaxID=838561 RepID=W0GN90_9MOLU|nr:MULTISPECIES: hypothetical protein [Spiroplasma]AHF60528.1 hypothetical protein SMM_0052 [Spiroplasma mirum ATCC 29335]AHI57439.1 hypothetical protein P344_00310 [Spiroplasma mirum ATCC 29335]AKM52650.1 hypothetical protein SATRI_v1c00540 [Spiroplasma atrichopogonis]